jgi:hypothetical protein
MRSRLLVPIAVLLLAGCRVIPQPAYPFRTEDGWIHDSAHSKHIRDDGRGGVWEDIVGEVWTQAGLVTFHTDFFVPDPPMFRLDATQ